TALEQAVALWPPVQPWGLWLQRVLLAPWERWDAGHYIRIVLQGYRLDDGTAQFHPLYPWLASPLARLAGLPLLALLLVSSLSGLLAAWLLYRLAQLDGDDDKAWTATLAFLFSPLAFVLFAPYSEALFLLLTLACFWFLRRRAWGLAGLMGGLAALTRQQGVLLLLPALWELWEAHGRDIRRAAQNWRAWGVLLLIPGGFLLWLSYRAWTLGDLQPDTTSLHALIYSLLISSSAAKVVPVQTFLWPWQAFAKALQQFAEAPDYRLFIDLFLAIGFVFMLIGVWKHLRGSYHIFVVSIALVSFTYHTGPKLPYMGLPRHLFLAFPVFIGLGAVLRTRWQRLALAAVSNLGMLFLLLQYVLEGWVP
ncbi:MAG: glycosyltransferase family 39 protein, partial [Anaerolineae bacterium]|nr:glycosyltransferase family 39 protein [Anaerolineae bacterium]